MRTLSNDGEVTAMLMAPDGRLGHRTIAGPPSGRPPGRRLFRCRQPSAIAPSRHRAAQRPLPGHQGHPTPLQGWRLPATDRRSGERVVIKQARPHVSADLYGRDVRDALRNEHDALQALRDTGLVPEAVDLFEQEGDLFLVQQEVAGVVLAQWLREQLAACDGPLTLHTAVPVALSLVDAVAAVHERGYVLRDLSVNNVMLGESGPRLVDLEYLARPGQTVRRVFTPGHVAPSNAAAPTTARHPSSAPTGTASAPSCSASSPARHRSSPPTTPPPGSACSPGSAPASALIPSPGSARSLSTSWPRAPTRAHTRPGATPHRASPHRRLRTSAHARAGTHSEADGQRHRAIPAGSRHTDDAEHLFPVGAT
ncbi:hypothetical protein V2I01_17695 [Micromonospora sp. BRA006-A]|nr:hypothetical protein [Micromonospora sp. BRA006-A]